MANFPFFLQILKPNRSTDYPGVSDYLKLRLDVKILIAMAAYLMEKHLSNDSEVCEIRKFSPEKVLS